MTIEELHELANKTYREFLETEMQRQFWGPFWSSLHASTDPDPSTEDTGDVTPEPPKPVGNPFYPKSRNPE